MAWDIYPWSVIDLARFKRGPWFESPKWILWVRASLTSQCSSGCPVRIKFWFLFVIEVRKFCSFWVIELNLNCLMRIWRKVDFVSSNVECWIEISLITFSFSCWKSGSNLAAERVILGLELFWIFCLRARFFGIWNSSSFSFSDKTGFGGRISCGSVSIESSGMLL